MKEKFFIYRKRDRIVISLKPIDLETLAEDYLQNLKDSNKFAIGRIFLKGSKIIDVEPRGFAMSELNKLVSKK